MTAPHPAPDALEAIVALLEAAPELAGVRVEDGPVPDEIEERDAIGVGLLTEDVDVVNSERTPRLRSTDELFEIVCVAQAWSGDPDLRPLRRRAFELVGVVGDVLVASKNLGLPGQVLHARITRTAYRPALTNDGPIALVEFVVRVAAYRRGG